MVGAVVGVDGPCDADGLALGNDVDGLLAEDGRACAAFAAAAPALGRCCAQRATRRPPEAALAKGACTPSRPSMARAPSSCDENTRMAAQSNDELLWPRRSQTISEGCTRSNASAVDIIAREAPKAMLPTHTRWVSAIVA